MIESIKQQLDDRGVSPVIGVILMVAITVILAAVIGSFVLGIGGDVEAAPQASISYDGNQFIHQGGDDLTNVNLNVEGDSDVSDTDIPRSAGATKNAPAGFDNTITIVHVDSGKIIAEIEP